MKELIYYPGFEVADKNWLKFALLYFDKIRPIIPEGIYDFGSIMSNDFLQVMEETDLISPYYPSFEEGNCASFLACEKIGRLIRYHDISPKHQYNAFNKMKTRRNTILYRGKYSSSFNDFCLENHIASPNEVGIEISEEFAFVYMSILADIISQNNGIEMITDKAEYLNLLIRDSSCFDKRVFNTSKIAKNNIELNIPANIDDIPLQTFVAIRNNHEFNAIRKAFVEEVERYINACENYDYHFSLEDFLSYKKDFVKICQQTINMIAATNLTILSARQMFNDPSTENISVFLSGMWLNYSFINTSGCKDFILNLKNKHLARRYLSHIKKMPV